MNAVVRSTLFDLSAQRARPNDPEELIFSGAYRTVSSPTTDETRGLLADLEEFVHDHRPCRPMTDATEAAWNGYRRTVACPCGVTFERWVTPFGCHRWHSCPSDTGSYVCLMHVDG